MKRPHISGGKTLKRELRIVEFRKEEFKIWEHFYVRGDNRAEFTTTALDELNTQQVHNLYRDKHHIPFPDEIKAIRDQYGLSAIKMSEVLDLGANSYRKYEAGEIPSLANSKLIRLAKDPENFLRFVKEKKEIFSESAYLKLIGKIDSLMETRKLDAVVEYIWNFHMEANEFTGYVKPDFEKVANFVLFFAQRANPLKTRMNKLMFYCDFVNFQRTGRSISGCNYRAIPFGPVPSHFHELFGVLQTEEFINIEEELFDHGGVGERFVPVKEFDASLFSEEELTSMEEVVKYFEDTRTRQIIELSHEESGWVDNQEQRELISYQKYGFQIKGVEA